MNADSEAVDPIDILLVEANPGDTRLFTEQFKDGKLLNTVHCVTDGESALEFISQRGAYAEKPRPDIVLIDPQLPKKSGQDVLTELNDDPELQDIPVVVLTSSPAGEAIVKAHDIEADEYLQKPIEPEEFVAFVQFIEEFWLAIVRETTADDVDDD